MRCLATCLALFVVTTTAAAQCPINSHPWVDAWGNRTCRDLSTGRTLSTEGSLSQCPVGTHPSVDSWGNRTCQSFGSGNQHYDTSAGCPIGTHPWIDSWGRNVCRRM